MHTTISFLANVMFLISICLITLGLALCSLSFSRASAKRLREQICYELPQRIYKAIAYCEDDLTMTVDQIMAESKHVAIVPPASKECLGSHSVTAHLRSAYGRREKARYALDYGRHREAAREMALADGNVRSARRLSDARFFSHGQTGECATMGSAFSAQ